MKHRRVSVTTPDSQPVQPPPKPKFISREDRIELENLALKLQNVQLQLQIMQTDLQKALSNRDELVGKMKAKREEFLEKYSIDVARVNIGDDGVATPHNIQFPGT